MDFSSFWLTSPRKCPKEHGPETYSRCGGQQSIRCPHAEVAKKLANMQYIRYVNWGLLLAIEGHHPFKSQEPIRDCRRPAIRFVGYSISYRRAGVTPKGGATSKWHASVRIDPATYQQLKNYFVMRARHRKAATLIEDFRQIPFARYAPIRRPILNIHLECLHRMRRRWIHVSSMIQQPVWRAVPSGLIQSQDPACGH